jgi:hypothetical protein
MTFWQWATIDPAPAWVSRTAAWLITAMIVGVIAYGFWQ